MTNHNQATAIQQLLPHAAARQQVLRLLTNSCHRYQAPYEDCRHAVSYAYEALAGHPANENPVPPDPEVMNDDRAAWAAAALRHFQSATGADFVDALADLPCDAMHWCDRNAVDFDDELSRARIHYAAETAADNLAPQISAGDASETPPSQRPVTAPQADAVTTKTYKAEFFTAADYAFRNFEAETPEQALQLARQFYDNDIGELDFRSYDDNAGLDQIQIWDSERGTLASWESDDYRLRKAGPELLKQSVRVLAMLPQCGIYNEVGMPELRAAVFHALGVEHDQFDARGFEAAISKAKTGDSNAS